MVFVVFDDVVIIRELPQLVLPSPQLLARFSFVRLSGPLLLNPCDVASLLLEVGFRKLLKVGIKSGELVPKQLLSKVGQ
jgi:hypothetical protein